MQTIVNGLGTGGLDGGFELRAVLAESLDQPVEQVIRSEVRNILDHVRDVDDRVPLEDAEFEIVKEEELHGSLLHATVTCVAR